MTGLDEHVEELIRRDYHRPGEVINDLDIRLLECLADGKAIPQIAAKMHLTAGAVGVRCRRMFARIGVFNAAHAVAWGFRNGYLKITPGVSFEEAVLDEKFRKAMHDLTGHDA